MDCATCKHLAEEYGVRDRAYAKATGALSAGRSKVRADEYIQLRTAASDARLDFEIARLELEKHTLTHVKAN